MSPEIVPVSVVVPAVDKVWADPPFSVYLYPETAIPDVEDAAKEIDLEVDVCPISEIDPGWDGVAQEV
ncbi:hypothetical protein AINA4_01030 [Aurantimicrobium sp. INA4]|nr:hypothetical protein AINA4_01030 [Aurantimicrobium sp. INA4]